MDTQLPSREPDLHQARVYRIPDTLTNWPWPARIGPHIDKINADLNVFVKGYPQLEGKASKLLEEAETGGSCLSSQYLMCLDIFALLAFFVCCAYPSLNEGASGKPVAIQRNHNPIAQLGVAASFVIIGWLVDKIDELNGARGIRAVSDIIMDALRYPSETRPVGEHILGEISRQ